MNPVFENFLEKVIAGSLTNRDLESLAGWLVKNTRHPNDPSKAWSFLGHEYQLAILSDPASKVSVRKCSQVGMSELAVRAALAMLGVYSGFRVIYTLPTTTFARKFTKDRFDSVINGSKQLEILRNRDVDNSEMKQIGTSFLYIQGSFGQSSAISVPAGALFRDEVDFSNQKTLSTFTSRLGHAEINPDGGAGYIRDFSTPTVSRYGISKGFEDGSQANYMVKHAACGKWVDPSPLTDVVIPGFDESILKFTKDDGKDPRVNTSKSWLKCPRCRKPISPENLADPEKRQWVHAFPDAAEHSYQVFPYDVPAVNPISKSVGNVTGYETTQDYMNFVWGLPYEDAESEFVEEVVKRGTVVTPVTPREHAATGCVAGLDVGKVSWLVIVKPGSGNDAVIWAEKIRQDGSDNLSTTVLKRMRQYGIAKIVVDAAPDFTTALKIIEESRHMQAFACVYVRKTKDKLATVDVDEVKQVVNADRTKTISALARDVNDGRLEFPKGLPITTDIHTHLKSLKKITRDSGDGNKAEAWISTGPDHLGMALNYAKIAGNLLDGQPSAIFLPNIPLIKKIKLSVPCATEKISRGVI